MFLITLPSKSVFSPVSTPLPSFLPVLKQFPVSQGTNIWSIFHVSSPSHFTECCASYTYEIYSSLVGTPQILCSILLYYMDILIDLNSSPCLYLSIFKSTCSNIINHFSKIPSSYYHHSVFCPS